MTPHEKAKDIYQKMFDNMPHPNETNALVLLITKQCALIAVDEMIKMYNEMNVNGFLKPNSVGFILNDVKNEIENL
jgi:hypothetical protein